MLVTCIHAYAGVRDVVHRHWRYYGHKRVQRVGVTPDGNPDFWPEPIPTLKASEDKYIDGCNLIEKFVASCEWLLVKAPDADQFLIIEYDSMILGPVPENVSGITGNVAKCDARWKVEAEHYIASPWLMDRNACALIAGNGRNAIVNGECQNGSPDVFLGWLCERAEIPFSQAPGVTFNCCSRDMRFRIEEAKSAVEHGAWFVHGVREPGECDAILGARPPR